MKRIIQAKGMKRPREMKRKNPLSPYELEEQEL
jgi:hypothetical protein